VFSTVEDAGGTLSPPFRFGSKRTAAVELGVDVRKKGERYLPDGSRGYRSHGPGDFGQDAVVRGEIGVLVRASHSEEKVLIARTHASYKVVFTGARLMSD
jgi:hypothetical protein